MAFQTSLDKSNQLKNLAIRRKAENLVGCRNIHEFHQGEFDKYLYVSPWTISANNVNADLMIIGQDWASAGWLNNPVNLQYAEMGKNPKLETNKNIEKYLKYFDLDLKDIYATNAFVFVKDGHMSGAIPTGMLEYCVFKYTLPQIEIIKPKMVICLGARTLNAVRKAINFPAINISQGHVDFAYYFGVKIFGTFHPGGLGTANAGGKVKAEEYWRFLAQEYLSIKNKPESSVSISRSFNGK